MSSTNYIVGNEYKNIRLNGPMFVFTGYFRFSVKEEKFYNISSTSLTDYMFSLNGDPATATYFYWSKEEFHNVSALLFEAISIKSLFIMDCKFYEMHYTLPS